MSYRKSCLIALRALRRNRLQTVLTVLGMMIGVGTVLVMIAVGSGAKRSIATQVRAAGMNIIVVTSGNYRMPQQWTSIGEAEEPSAWNPEQSGRFLRQDGVYHAGVRARLRPMQSNPGDNPFQKMAQGPQNLGGLGAAKTLTLGDAALVAKLDGVQNVSAGVHENATAVVANESWTTQLRGEEPSLPEIRRAWVIPHGRFFTAAEDAGRERVAVLGSIAAQRLFGDRNPVGESITVHEQPFRVIGTVASGSWMVPAAAGDGQFDAIYVPVRTAQQLLGRDNLDTITLSTFSAGEVSRLARLLAADLRQWHHLSSLTPDDFTVASQARSAIARGGMRTDISRAMMGNAAGLDKVTLAQLSQTLEHASRTMAVLLASIATVSLVVGGIGIMNIMLLSVTERTREIGIRRAVGAQSSAVMEQFLMEAVMLSVGGGLLGIGLGLISSAFVTQIVHWSTEISWAAIAASFAISVVVGIVFGYYPAQQASRVTPMTALRYE